MKNLTRFLIFSCASFLFMCSASYSASLSYNGIITNVIEYNCGDFGMHQPYANVGDELNIFIAYDENNLDSINIIIYLESWGEMFPSKTTLNYFHSTNNWCYYNDGTNWSLLNNIFTLESDNFSSIITGYVNYPSAQTPEPSTMILFVLGFFSFFYRNTRKKCMQ